MQTKTVYKTRHLILNTQTVDRVVGAFLYASKNGKKLHFSLHGVTLKLV